MNRLCVILVLVSLPGLLIPVARAQAPAPAAPRTIDVPFTSHDGHPMFGKLTLPESGAPKALLMYVQRRRGGRST